ncbi:hypothetical protein [Citrobacter sp. Cf098]|uniref:hypothetical protein n=1 Tax=Citrobacter sp. Cf098 TaxID=2985060 RepID=UPI0025759B14|nr:hypothetical protein [Citrobacter sp. Cf098]MDM3182008.1 hypothetical protein [Citrobacter sp. Cf098]MDM3182376.1 hypothetical protein [Citrobacter sp. Cf098]
MDKLSEWLTSGEYLPHFMRDFHDQKDVFKAMHNTIHNADKNGNPRDAHIYVVDTFLWYMARCGYTLQKSRKDVPFKDMQADIDRYKAEIQSDFSSMISGK